MLEKERYDKKDIKSESTNPSVLVRPCVVFSPTMPHNAEGIRTDPDIINWMNSVNSTKIQAY
jgi:hypothetical protein